MPGCRYKWGRHLAWLYDRKLFAALEKVDVIIASADEDSVSGLIGRSKGRLSRDRVVQFPTRVDTDVFKPLSQDWARQVVGIPNGRGPIVVASGRICLAKGWELVHDAFAVFREKHPHAHLYFVGDGEQRPFLENRVERMNLRSHVTITGFLTREQVALYLNAADLCVVGSRREGWSNAMLEGLACGKPMVSTDVSGASAMIINGVNGYITHERDPRVFADAMRMALALQSARDVSVHLSEKYAVKSLAADLCAIWQYAV
jgi:glycosyltransferase involved in cell wall biosynthesis